MVTAAAAGKGRCDAIASELRSMINGYRIDSHTAFPFIRRRRHPPTNSQCAFKAAVLWHTASGGSAVYDDSSRCLRIVVRLAMDFDPIFVSRLQFAWVIGWHILLPAFTVGLAAYIALLEGSTL